MLAEEIGLTGQQLKSLERGALLHDIGKIGISDTILHKPGKLTEDYEGNASNALRALLRKAVDQIKPEGDRRFTSEWILYNILEMKFIEGRKVREVAGRLAMSEADLYRKQRVAVEAVARAILDMEQNEGIR